MNLELLANPLVWYGVQLLDKLLNAVTAILIITLMYTIFSTIHYLLENQIKPLKTNFIVSGICLLLCIVSLCIIPSKEDLKEILIVSSGAQVTMNVVNSEQAKQLNETSLLALKRVNTWLKETEPKKKEKSKNEQ